MITIPETVVHRLMGNMYAKKSTCKGTSTPVRLSELVLCEAQ